MNESNFKLNSRTDACFLLKSFNDFDDYSYSTCFAISQDIILTAKHAVEDFNESHCYLSTDDFNFNQANNNGKPLKILYCDDKYDFAILKSNNLLFPKHIPLGRLTVQQDESIFVYGYPVEKSGLPAPLTTRVIQSFEKIETSKYSFEINIVENVSNYRGMSGSPVLVNGFCVGVLIVKGPASLYVISLNEIEKKIKSKWDQAPSKELEDILNVLNQSSEVVPEARPLNIAEQLSDSLQAMFSNFLNKPGGPTQAFAIIPHKFSQPKITYATWNRQKLINQTLGVLTASDLYVYGSLGMGKTTLVSQILSKNTNVIWADLRDKKPHEVDDTLADILKFTVEAPPNPILVLDDLNIDDARPILKYLSLVLDELRKQQGKIIITSYSKPKPRLASIVGLKKEALVKVPRLDGQEIRDLLKDSGCPAERIKGLSKALLMQTGGHPTFLSVRIDSLKTRGFPLITIDEILKPSDEIQELKKESLSIVKSVLSENQRNLLYRLSLAIPSLRQTHVNHIGAEEPEISEPGEHFLALLGPWVEQPGEDSYRVSALVNNIAERVYSREKQREIHGMIARALMVESELSVEEYSGIITHSLLGHAERELATALIQFFTAPKFVKKIIAEEQSMLSSTGVSPGTTLFINDTSTRYLFRIFQWDIVEITKKEYDFNALSKIMESEYVVATSSDGMDPIKIPYLTKLLFNSEYYISPDKVIDYMIQIQDIVDRLTTDERFNAFSDTDLQGDD